MVLDLQQLWQNVVKAAFDEKPKEPGASDRRGGPGQLSAGGSIGRGNASTLAAGACICPSGAVKK